MSVDDFHGKLRALSAAEEWYVHSEDRDRLAEERVRDAEMAVMRRLLQRLTDGADAYWDLVVKEVDS